MTMKGAVADFISAADVEVWLQEMAAQKRIENTADAAALLGVSRDTALRIRKRGGDKMLALAMTALLKKQNPYKPAPGRGAELPEFPTGIMGRPLGVKDSTKRKSRKETEAAMRERIEAEVKAKYGIAENEAPAEGEAVAA